MENSQAEPPWPAQRAIGNVLIALSNLCNQVEKAGYPITREQGLELFLQDHPGRSPASVLEKEWSPYLVWSEEQMIFVKGLAEEPGVGYAARGPPQRGAGRYGAGQVLAKTARDHWGKALANTARAGVWLIQPGTR